MYVPMLLVGILSYITEFAEKLDLDIPTPLTPDSVRKFVPFELEYPSGLVTLTNGSEFYFTGGYVTTYTSAWSQNREMSRSGLPPEQGPAVLTLDDAVRVAREAVRRLGYDEELLNMDLEPEVRVSPKLGTTRVPQYYLLEWGTHHVTRGTVRAEINAASRELAHLSVISPTQKLSRDAPLLPIKPTIIRSDKNRREPLEGEVAAEHLCQALPQIAHWVTRFNLPIALPLDPQAVRSVTGHRYEQTGYVQSLIVLTNGWRFGFNEVYVSGFKSPDAMFIQEPVRVKRYVGSWRITEAEAVELARAAARKTWYPQRVIDLTKAPRVQRALKQEPPVVPRLDIEWEGIRRGYRVAAVGAEVNCERGTVEGVGVWVDRTNVPDWPEWEYPPIPAR